MCGRIVQSEPTEYARRLGVLFGPEDDWQPRWNLAPTDAMLGVRDASTGRRMEVYRWGLLPAWANDPKAATRSFNARAETVATNPVFREAFRRRRLLVPVDGFYEWEAIPGTRVKRPHVFVAADGGPLVLAGLWERWRRGDDIRFTATVITTAAGPDMPIHDRQPVVLGPAEWDRWLDPDSVDVESLEDLLVAGTGLLAHHPVAKDVGSVKNDGPWLLDPVPIEEATPQAAPTLF